MEGAVTWTGTQDLGGVLLFDPSEEGQDRDGYSWDVKRRGGKTKQLWPVKERREGRSGGGERGEEGSQMEGRVRAGVQIGKPLRVGRFQPWEDAKGLRTWISVSLE